MSKDIDWQTVQDNVSGKGWRDMGTAVRRCKLDPGLKAPCFQPFNPEIAYIAFNVNLVSELAPLHAGEKKKPQSKNVASDDIVFKKFMQKERKKLQRR